MYLAVIKYWMNRPDPPLLLEDRFILEAQALWFKPHHFMFDVLDRKLQQYTDGGLLKYNARDFEDEQNPKRFQELKKSFAVLTLGELEAGFVVCIVPFVLSVFVFIIEWMLTTKNLLIFLLMFKKYFEVAKLEQSVS